MYNSQWPKITLNPLQVVCKLVQLVWNNKHAKLIKKLKCDPTESKKAYIDDE